MGWKVKFFQTSRGDSPVEDFIKEQDEATYAKALQAIQLLANNGPFLRSQKTPSKELKVALDRMRELV